MILLKLILLLPLYILCTCSVTDAAMMKYSFQLEVGSGATFNGDAVNSSTLMTIELIGDTNNSFVDEVGGHIMESKFFDRRLVLEGYGAYDLFWDFDYTMSYMDMAGYCAASIYSSHGGGLMMVYGDPGVVDLAVEQVFMNPGGEGLGGTHIFSRGVIETVGGDLEWAEELTLHPAVAFTAQSVPLPGSVVLFCSGFALLIGFKRKLTS